MDLHTHKTPQKANRFVFELFETSLLEVNIEADINQLHFYMTNFRQRDYHFISFLFRHKKFIGLYVTESLGGTVH